MKKRMAVWLLMGAVLLAGCDANSTGSNPQKQVEPTTKQATIEPKQEMNPTLHWLGSSEGGQVKLYDNREAKDSHHIFTLEINGNTKDFDWYYLGDMGTDPQVHYTDLTGDGKEEAVVIIQTGRGTGLNNYDIHVVNADDFSEIRVQSYEDIVANYIESHVKKNGDGTLAIAAEVQGQVYNFDYDFDPAPDHDQDELGFGGVTIYRLENQKIKLNLPGSVGISPTYVCDFNVTYAYDKAKNEFIVDQIEVEPIENGKG
ncbi:hypothetical protein [Paenibacillus illinoisensis]|uniref:Lipoprotein n=1 Tax=Paenibacillus illinoisensis TaxID=59845 RepID=A0A2W0CF10_9BACL|nr:hypothetical protein [Paenibacillus illinoisensis]PYY31266.1 Uncharacterized protein PIL02S_00357 [Paenibacillus illinoisensis]